MQSTSMAVDNMMDPHLFMIRGASYPLTNVTTALRDRGYTIIGSSKFDFAADPGLAETFDLILIDHSEPRLNAMQICTELRQRNVEAPVVILTNRDQIQDRV